MKNRMLSFGWLGLCLCLLGGCGGAVKGPCFWWDDANRKELGPDYTLPPPPMPEGLGDRPDLTKKEIQAIKAQQEKKKAQQEKLSQKIAERQMVSTEKEAKETSKKKAEEKEKKENKKARKKKDREEEDSSAGAIPGR